MRRIIQILCMFLVITSGLSFASASEKFTPAGSKQRPEIFVQLGQGPVSTVAFSPDGKYVVTGSDDLTVKLWDVASGREIRTFRGHAAKITAVGVSSDGGMVVSGDEKGVIKLWYTVTGQEIKSIQGHAKQIGFLSFASDNRLFTSVAMDWTMKTWNAATGQLVKTTINIRGLPFMASGNTFVAASNDLASNSLSLLDISNASEIGTFKADKGIFFTSASFSRDGKYALLMRNDYNLQKTSLEFLDIAANKTIAFWHTDRDAYYAALSPDGRQALSAGKGGLKLWDVFSGKELMTYTTDYTTVAAFSPDGRFIVSTGHYVPTLWEASTGQIVRSFASRPLSGVYRAMLSPDGSQAIANSSNAPSLLWDIRSGKPVKIYKDYAGARGFVADGKYIFLQSKNNTSELWDIAADKLLKIFPSTLVGWSRDGRYVAELLSERNIKVQEFSTGKEILNYTEPSGKIASFSLAANNRYLLIIVDNTAKRIDLEGGAEEKFSWAEPNYHTAKISSDGKSIAVIVSGRDLLGKNTLKLYDVEARREVGSYECNKSFDASLLDFSPDGRQILFSVPNNQLVLADTTTGAVLKTFTGHTGPIYDFKFFPQGERIVSAGADLSIRLWDTASGRTVMTFSGHENWVRTVSISRDGKHILSVGHDSTTRLWDISTGKEIAQFISFTDGEWIVITPEGYFNASPNGAKHLNVRVGNNVYSIDNFYEKFFNPVYVASVLQGKKVEAVADIRKGILTPPDVKIISPEPNTSFSKDTIDITVSAKDTGGGIDEIRLYHNGKAIGEDTRGVKIVPKGSETIKTYTVTLVDGLNTFRATAFSKDRIESNPYELIVKLTAPSKDVSMYIFAVGINKYKNPALNLNYAEPDARGIVEFFNQKGKGLFKNVEIREIYNEQATKQIIISKLKQLENTNPQDAVLIYLAGHGENISDKWYFIPHELTYPEREEDVKTKGISSDELSGYIKNIRAQKILVLIDACKSGAVLIAFRGFEDRKALSQLSRSTGVHIIAASTKDQFAAEVKDLGHGVFTYILLEGLKGKAAGDGKTVTVFKLKAYIEEQLPEITKKYKQEAQYPVGDSSIGAMDFPLVTVK